MIVDQPLLDAGAALYGVDPGSYTAMGGTDGAVYGCRLHNREYVMKFVPMEKQNIPAYFEKLEFVHYLSDHGIPIAMPVPSKNGQHIEQIEGDKELYLVTLAPRAVGRHPSLRIASEWNDNLFTCWGQVMGKMHALTQQYPRWENNPDSSSSAPPTRIEGWREEHKFFEEWSQEPEITAKWMELYPLLEALPRDRSTYGLVHNDLHQMNFFYNPYSLGVNCLTIIDFDVCAYNWFLADIAIAAYHAAANGSKTSLLQRQMQTRAFLNPFLRGYKLEYTLDDSWLEHLPLFMKYREILLYIAMTNSMPEEERQQPSNKRWLGDKRIRTLKTEPII